MADMRLTDEKMHTFDDTGKTGFLKAGEKLAEFGEQQNAANTAIAYNINELIERVCDLENMLARQETNMQILAEDIQKKHEEIMRRVAAELSAFRKELDRLRLSDKLNTNAVARLNNAINLVTGNSGEN